VSGQLRVLFTEAQADQDKGAILPGIASMGGAGVENWSSDAPLSRSRAMARPEISVTAW